jgi:hypothetical protein
VVRCARCGEPTPAGVVASRDAKCAGCDSELHTCTNCSAFDPGAHFECRLEIPERISPKDRANRCEQFEPRTTQEFAAEKPRADDPRSAFDALFKL